MALLEVSYLSNALRRTIPLRVVTPERLEEAARVVTPERPEEADLVTPEALLLRAEA